MTSAESEALLQSVEALRDEVAAVREDTDRLRQLPDGGSSLYEHCPLERCFRDVNAALGHVTLQRPVLEDAGRVRLGLKPNGPLF